MFPIPDIFMSVFLIWHGVACLSVSVAALFGGDPQDHDWGQRCLGAYAFVMTFPIWLVVSLRIRGLAETAELAYLVAKSLYGLP